MMYQSGSYPQGSWNSYGGAPPRPVPYEPALPSSTPGVPNGPSVRQSLPSMDENAATALLKHLDRSELQGLLDNESKLDDLVTDLQQVKNIQVERETLLASNKSVAEYNLAFAPRLDKLKGEVATDHEEVRRLKGLLEEDRAKLLLSSNDQSAETLLALLQTECAETEENSEELAEKFCDKSIQAEEFIEQFVKLRTLAHLRRVKCDKMAELLQNQSPIPPVPPPRTQPAANKGWYSSGVGSVAAPASNPSYSAPYPSNNPYMMMMPEPFPPR